MSISTFSRHEGVRFYFISLEFFFYMFEPRLAAFKFYMWSRVVWKLEDYKLKKFNFEPYLNNKDLIKQIKNLETHYRYIPSIEIWGGGMLNTTLQQIRYCNEAGLFENEDEGLKLCEALKSMLDKLNKIAELGEKNLDGNSNIQIWYNEIFETNNTVLIELEGQQFMYFLFDAPNFLITSQTKMFSHGMAYFEQMKSFSKDIIGNNERNRHQCFKMLTRKIESLEKV